jgi:hypothetical protein
MNDETLRQLKIIVERVVRPILAGGARKRRMRDELLNHAIAIFEEEVLHGEGTDASIERVRQRLGDPAALSSELQASVGMSQRIEGRLYQLLRFRPDESPLRRAARNAALVFVAISAEILAVCGPILLLKKADPDPARSPAFLVSMTLVVSASFFVFTLLVHGLRQALFLGSRRSLLRGFVMLSLAPATIFLAAFVFGFMLDGGKWSFGDPLLIRNIAILAALSHMGLLAFAAQTSKEIRYAQEWATLPIDE